MVVKTEVKQKPPVLEKWLIILSAGRVTNRQLLFQLCGLWKKGKFWVLSSATVLKSKSYPKKEAVAVIED